MLLYMNTRMNLIQLAFVILLTKGWELAESKTVLNANSKTIIIGAGIAGLAAAAHLEENGFEDYLILEATSRAGGRLKTLIQDQDGTKYPLEIGAGWIHGTKKNPIYDLAKQNDLLEKNDWSHEDKDSRFTEWGEEYRLDDSTLLPSSVWEPVQKLSETANEDAASFTQGVPAGYSDSSSVEDYILDEFYEEFNGSSDAVKWMNQRSVLETFLSYQTWDSGCHSMKEVSLRYYGSFEDLGDTDVPLPMGYETVVNVVKHYIPSEKIKFDHVVEKIVYSTDNPTLTIKCKNGQNFAADQVIVTASLGYLRDNAANLFEPPLPQKKISAMNRMGFGTVDRIYLEFDNLNFITDTDVGALYFIRKPDDLKDTTDWVKKVFTCYVQDVPKANMLTCWLTGMQAEEMEKKTDEEVSSKMRSLLQQFLGTAVPAPLKIVRSKWYSEEFTKGSYSFIKVGASPQDIQTIAEPLYLNDKNDSKPILMFAGEATSEEYFSSVHGAYLSGIREAERITDSAAGIPNVSVLLMTLMNAIVIAFHL